MKDPYQRTRKHGDQPGRKPRRVHRVLAEQLLERPLLPSEVVHHRDGDKTNNAPENIAVLPSQSHHMVLEHYQRREAAGIVHLFDLETWVSMVADTKIIE